MADVGRAALEIIADMELCGEMLKLLWGADEGDLLVR